MRLKLPCLFQFRILKLAVISLFTKPFTTKFPFEPYEPIKEFRGRPRYDEKECIGCGACAEVCPSSCIDVIDETDAEQPNRTLVQHLDACICCGQCERYCTSEKGIKLSNEYDFVGFKPEDFEEKVQKDLLLCECCNEVIAPLDQIKWLIKKLGPLTFTNPTLMLVSHSELSLLDKSVKSDPNEENRGNRMNILCPHCRRKSTFQV